MSCFLEKPHIGKEIEEFISGAVKLTRFRDNRSLPLSGFFGKYHEEKALKQVVQKCKLTFT